MQVDSYPMSWVHKIPSTKRKRISSPTQKESAKKRSRRTAAEIERKHKCMYAGCRKSYGSDGALKMHIKLKHAPQQVVPPTYPPHTAPVFPLPAPKVLSLPSSDGGASFDPSLSWLYELPSDSALDSSLLELDQVFPQEPPPAEPCSSPPSVPDASSSSPLPSPPLCTPEDTPELDELAEIDAFDISSMVPEAPHSEAFGPCGSIYFALTHTPTSNPPSLFAINNIRVGCWCQYSQSTVDLSLQVDSDRNTLRYYIEDCTLPLNSLEMSTSLKIEFHLDSVREYCLESHGQYLYLLLSLQFSPCFYSCSVPRGHMFDPNTIRWSPAQDFTQNQATDHRFHILKIVKGDDRTEARLKSIFAACKIRYNAQVALTLDDGTVFQMRNQLAKYESLLLDQRFKRTEKSFRGDQPLFRVHTPARPSHFRSSHDQQHHVQSPLSPAISLQEDVLPFYYPPLSSEHLEILS